MVNYAELFVGFFYGLIFLGIAYFVKSLMTSNKTAKFFLPALVLKMIGGLTVGLIYYYYYGGGDTITYYKFGAQYIYEAFLNSPALAFELIFGDNTSNPDIYPYSSKIWVFRDDASYFCVRFAGFFNLLSFNTYSGTVLFFSFFSFICVWRLYQLLVDFYPDLYFQFAVAFLFLPSVFFWGSGILKDTITFAFLCLLVHSVFRIYFNRNNIFLNAVIILISGFYIASIKVYILIALVPAITFLFLYGPIKKIKNQIFRVFLTPIILVFAVILGYFSIQQVGEIDSKYSLDKMAETAESTARWIHHVSVTDGGSAYSLGDYDFSGLGILKKTIPAIWVSLFRPHPWEARNPVMALSAIEALFFLFLFVRAYLRKPRLNKKAQSLSIIIPFCLIFSIIFSWAVGLTTYNFGSLVRYKIPMMPFFIVAMYLMEHNKKELLKRGY